MYEGEISTLEKKDKNSLITNKHELVDQFKRNSPIRLIIDAQ